VAGKVGRPSSYKEAYCNEVIEFLSQGHSVTAFAGHIGVARSSVFKWAEEIPEFSDALKIGQAKATAFWETILVKVARDGGGNATAAIFGLKNRAGEDWADKTVSELTGKDGGAIQVDSLTTADRARALAAFISKTKTDK
jgi:hypothetical protein